MARISWDEMVEQYPDMWVAVKDAEMDGADIMSGEVVTALPDDEIIPFRIANWGSGLVVRRTTEGNWSGGPITSDFRIRVE